MSNGDDQKISFTVGDRLLIQAAVDGVGRIEDAFKAYMLAAQLEKENHDKLHTTIERRLTSTQNRQQNVRKFFKILAASIAAVGTLVGVAAAFGLL